MLSKSEKQTMDIASKFAKSIKNPCIILLQGDLGAGKTHFVKGFVKGLKCKMLVTSPTFTIMNIYDSGRMPVYHFDLYRITDPQEAEMLGFEEYFDHDQLKGVSIVEWPQQAEELVRDWDYKIVIDKVDDNQRQIQIIKRG